MKTYDEMIADVVQLMRKSCEEAGADYDEFVMKLNDAVWLTLNTNTNNLTFPI